MKKFTKILILSIFTILMIGGFSSKAFAEVETGPLGVSFNPTPLFNVANFMPGDYKNADITVTNNSDTSQNAYIEAVNVSNTDDLASQMTLQISEGTTEIYNNNFKTFLNAGPVSLSNIVTGSPKTYNLKVTFLENTDNDYQGKSLGFDICVGFKGGSQTCTNTTTIGDEQDPDGGSNGGGGTSGSIHLVIWNENASNISANGIIPESGTATITWNTNIPATSQVIYGLASGAPYPFDINNPPKFGYTFVNNEDLTKTVNHGMLLEGLTPGETYVYRVVSRASPATVSPEHQFTIPFPTQINNNLLTNNANGEEGTVLGASTENLEEDAKAEGNSSNTLAANVFGSGFNNILSFCSGLSLLIILLIYLIWRLWLRRKYEQHGIPKEEIKNRFYLFFSLAFLLVIIVLLILAQYCPLKIFILLFIVSSCFYTYRKLK